MSEPDSAIPKRALVVGIDRYIPVRTAARSLYPNLGGCVADAERITAWLGSRGMPRRDIRCLTQPIGRRSPDAEPTYGALIEAFARLTEETERGDQVFVYFAGHGGRVPSILSTKTLDETLVPSDVASPGGRHLRDVELLVLIERLIHAGAFLTLVLDSCHSGGTGARAGGVRGRGDIDRTVRPPASRVAGMAELEDTWRRRRRAHRDLVPGSGWLPDPRGYVLLAACRANELAHETYFGRRLGGMLTHALLEAVAAPSGASWDALAARVLARVHAAFPGQTPVLEGERDRRLFGAAAAASPVDTETAQIAVAEGKGTSVALDLDADHRALVAAHLARIDAGVSVTLVAPGARAAVTVSALGGAYRLRDAQGREITAADRPPVQVGDENELIRRLLHVARFEARRAWKPAGPSAPSELIAAVLHPLAGEPVAGCLPDSAISGAGVRRLSAAAGDWLMLELTNRSPMPLNLAVLDLRPTFAVTQVFPPRGFGPFVLIEAGARRRVPFRAALPHSLSAGTDVLRVVAALEPFDLRALELPPLHGRPAESGARHRSPTWDDDSEETADALADPAFWQTIDMEVRVTSRTL